jgi:hypothetical protein
VRALVLVLLVSACVDPDPPRLRTLVTVVATQEGQPAAEATRQLVAEGRKALVVIEAALHTAEPAGRRRLVRAIGMLHDEDGCALLQHVAQFDEDEATQKTANDALRSWGRPLPGEPQKRPLNACVPVGG